VAMTPNDSLMATTAHVKQHSKPTLCLKAYTPRGREGFTRNAGCRIGRNSVGS